MVALQILSARRTFADGRFTTKFEILTNRLPTQEEVYGEQNRLGYSPFGYGGPSCVKTERRHDGNFVTTWQCAGSCD